MASAPLKGTESAANAIERVKYSHDAMIDLIIAQPAITQNELAKQLGYSVPWVSRVYNSDAFQARLAERKGDLVDPSIVHSIQERLQGVVSQSLEVLADKLEQTKNVDVALKVLDIGTKALGYGARPQSQTTVQNNFVVRLPEKAQSAADWAAEHTPGVGGAAVIAMVPGVSK